MESISPTEIKSLRAKDRHTSSRELSARKNKALEMEAKGNDSGLALE